MKNLWLWKCGLPEEQVTSLPHNFDLEELRISEWSPVFETLMRNRLLFGVIRYGPMGHGKVPPGKPKYDRCTSIRKRLEFFEDSGNAEWLVDIANMALLMFEERQHPNFHFRHQDDGDGSYHDEILND